MRRLFWLGVGLAVGVLVVRQLTKTAQSYSPSGLAASAKERASGFADNVRGFVAEVKAGAAEHEQELIAAVEADTDPRQR